MRRLLIVSPHFPPVAAPDMQRVRMSLAHYRKSGWDPVVLAVEPDGVAAPQEADLLNTFPGDIAVHRCRAWPRRFGFGTVGLRALQPLHHEGARLLGAQRFDLVFFSTTQFITLLLGRRWRHRFGVPYVVDIQDPWRTAAYEQPGAPRPPGGWKYQFARLVAWRMEERCFRDAAGFVSVSPRYLADLGRRYPWFAARPQATIPFGIAPEDFLAAQRLPLPAELPARIPGEVRLVYTGAAGPIVPQAAAALFAGLHRYRQQNPAQANRLRLLFLGTHYVPAGQSRPALESLTAQHAVADLVFELPHRLGHLQSLRCLLEADALLLLGSIDPAYSPSKLYPYYLAGKPILGLVFADSHLEQLLRELACSWLVTIPSAATPDAVSAGLAGFFDLALTGFPPAALPPRNDEFFNRNCLAETLTRRQCELFAQAIAAS
jgi:hypothetical protein